jgi:hypothetical protein
MKIKLVGYLKTIFKRREWDPNTFTGLGDWELGATEYTPAVTHTENSRGIPHPDLPLSYRLKKVQADLDAFKKSLPDLNEPQS